MKKLLVILVVALLFSSSSAQKVKGKFIWGEYGVRIEKLSDAEAILRIIKNGRTQVSIRDFDFSTEFVEVTGRPPKELWVSTFSGGAHCCFTSYLFTQEGGLRNILALFHGNGGMEVQDLDSDGRGELIIDIVYAYFGDLCYACSPKAVTVYSWDGARFYETTRRFPKRTQALAARYKSDCENALSKGANATELEPCALGYWANMLRVGEGSQARSWLMAKMPYAVRRWLVANEDAIINSASPLPRNNAPKLPAENR
ncbi:hypothetical protein ACMC9I_03385 [Deinococcota bacterium DY0809b]